MNLVPCPDNDPMIQENCRHAVAGVTPDSDVAGGPTRRSGRVVFEFRRLLSAGLCLVSLGVTTVAGSEWKMLEGCVLLPNRANDGDSFHVRHDGKEYIFRLYLADAPETNLSQKERVAEQMEAFGVDQTAVLKAGQQATEFTAKLLEKPFQVVTRFEDALGDSKIKRHYAVVRPVGQSKDLAELLVEAGLARAYGKATSAPKAPSFPEIQKLEDRARKAKAGIFGGGAPGGLGGVVIGGMTADEAFEKARALFLEKKYEESLGIYEQFIRDYGSNDAAQTAVRNSRYPVAMCQILLGRFAEALGSIDTALAMDPPLPEAQVRELAFWQGVVNMQLNDHAGARESLERFVAMFEPGVEKNPLFVRRNPMVARVPEARSLIGTAMLLNGNYREAADHFKAMKGELAPEARGRAVIFQLYALLELGEDDEAIGVVLEEYPRMEDIAQLISFQSLTLQLGNRWLDKGDFRKAIQCLQRVWTFDRLVKRQEERLEALESRRKAAEENASLDPYTRLLFTRLVSEVRRELENFRKVESFDASLRFRLAMAYLRMKRYQEAALVMEGMISELPADPLTEQAALNVVRCWTALEDWPAAADASRRFVERFPDSKHVPEALFLEAEAMQSSLMYEEAVAAYGRITEAHPSSEYAIRSRFMRAFCLLLAERNMDGAEAFRDFLSRHPKHAMADGAAYWLGMAYSYDKQYDECRELMDAYLESQPDGRYRGAAVFRKAYCLQQMERFGEAIDELHGYLEKFPAEPENSEAKVLLGNAMMNEGALEEGFKVFASIPPEDVKPYEEGVFRTAEGLKLLEEPERYRELMEKFLAEMPQSPRLGEAVRNMGWYYRQTGEVEKAREMHWRILEESGNDPAIKSTGEIFQSLARLYRGPGEPEAYAAMLREKSDAALSGGRETFAMRLIHAQAKLATKADPALSMSLLARASAYADPAVHSPEMLVDFGNALIETGRVREGEMMLRDTLRWNPRAIEKDRILAALGQLEMERGNEDAAMVWFDRFEKETMGTPVFGPVMLAKARLLAKADKREEMRRVLEAVLSNEGVRGEQKAEALYLIGESHMAENNPKLAIPYFQRIYVMHQRWRPWVAKAYRRSGEAFELLQDQLSARRTYQELTANPDLEEFPETADAKARLEALGGPVPSGNESEENGGDQPNGEGRG